MPSPSPEYPQNIHVVTGDCEISFIDENSQDYPLTLDNIELCKIGNYEDCIYNENNNWYLYKIIDKIILNGSENWYINSNVFNIRNLSYKSTELNEISVICDTYQGVGNVNSSTSAYNRGNNTICNLNDNTTSRLFIRDDRFTSVSDFKIELSSNNVTVYYILNTPTIVQITDETLISQLDNLLNASLYTPTTAINSTGEDLSPILDIIYEEYFNWYDFNRILLNGYEINEQPNIISKKQYANGKRKKIQTEYEDVIIKVNMGCFDGNTLADYLEKMQDGEYKYYSLKDKQMKNANFIVTLPTQKIQSSADEIIVDDFEALLEKSGDVE